MVANDSIGAVGRAQSADSSLCSTPGNQFGNGYADDAQGLRDFRKKFIRRLKEVLLFYPEASDHIQDAGENLRLTPCVLHLAHTGQAKLSKIPKPGNPDKPEK